MIGRFSASLAVLLLTACVRAGFYGGTAADTTGTDVAGVDAAVAEAGAVDARGDRATIDPYAPFSTPVRVSISKSNATDDDPSLTEDQLEIFFNRDETRIYVATRASTSAAWSTPVPVQGIAGASGELDSSPEVSADGLTLRFSSKRSHPKAAGSYDIYVVTRAARGAPWSTPQPIEPLNSKFFESGGHTSSDGRTIGLLSDRNGVRDIFFATRATPAASWGAPKALAQLNSSANESSPWFDDTGRVFFFSSKRDGDHDDIFAAEADATLVFAKIVPVASLNTSADDGDPWLSQDLKTIYFASSRGGRMDIYTATR